MKKILLFREKEERKGVWYRFSTSLSPEEAVIKAKKTFPNRVFMIGEEI